MKRALLIVLDSVGCGAAPDAEKYGDTGANTLGHILAQIPDLQIPTLRRLGWNEILGLPGENEAARGIMQPAAAGKDTTTGHWELAGAILCEPFAVFEHFPPELVEAIENAAQTKFIGNYARSGTEILEELGQKHLDSGHPILYTSADSVVQIAAHEEIVPLARLYEICEIARKICDGWRIGRMIARPFIGKNGNWQRTTNRHDYSLVPPRTVLNVLQENSIETTGIGKVSDIFAGSGISQSFPTKSNADGMKTIENLWREGKNGFYFANLVDFDMLFGHRRDVAGYGRSLEEFDLWLGDFLPQIGPDDLVLITADHGNDPTMPGTDHTRENVPILALGLGNQNLGVRETFADVAATVGAFFGVKWETGKAF